MRNLACKCTKGLKLAVTSTEDVIKKISKANLCIINRQEGQEEDDSMFEDGTG
jgi:hypothetical protein